jgi:hypothetical protein
LAQCYNRNRIPQPFKIGDIVYYMNNPISDAGRRIAVKLLPWYKGPYRVDTFLTPVTVRLVDPGSDRIVTRWRMSHY